MPHASLSGVQPVTNQMCVVFRYSVVVRELHLKRKSLSGWSQAGNISQTSCPRSAAARRPRSCPSWSTRFIRNEKWQKCNKHACWNYAWALNTWNNSREAAQKLSLVVDDEDFSSMEGKTRHIPIIYYYYYYYYTIIYYNILYYTILYYTILYYTNIMIWYDMIWYDNMLQHIIS